jgi:hypothetical protein
MQATATNINQLTERGIALRIPAPARLFENDAGKQERKDRKN